MKYTLRGELIENGSLYVLQIPEPLRETFVKFDEMIKREFNGYIQVIMKKPTRPRSTGKHSQNNCSHGWPADLAVQAETEWLKDPDMMYRYLVILAMDKDIWPHFEIPGKPGLMIPESQAGLSMEQMTRFLKFVERIADKKEKWLTRLTPEGMPYRSICGRTLEEMKQVYPNLNTDYGEWKIRKVKRHETITDQA